MRLLPIETLDDPPRFVANRTRGLFRNTLAFGADVVLLCLAGTSTTVQAEAREVGEGPA